MRRECPKTHSERSARRGHTSPTWGESGPGDFRIITRVCTGRGSAVSACGDRPYSIEHSLSSTERLYAETLYHDGHRRVLSHGLGILCILRPPKSFICWVVFVSRVDS